MFGIRTAKIVFALSLLISCLTFGAGDPGVQLSALKGQTPETQLSTLNTWAAKGELDPALAKKLGDINQQLDAWDTNGDTPPKNWLSHQMQECVQMLAMEQQVDLGNNYSSAVVLARKIKSSPIYHDTGPKEGANWLSNAFDRLNNIHPDCGCNHPVSETPSAGLPGSEALIYGIYAVLIIALAAFIIFAVSRFSWSKKLQRKAKALLDEDEPERTLDEWLDMADKLEREGRYREAVRCLYLACLLKIDEARIARFERSQTNWEHLERIENSPARPPDLDFREPTKAFDVIWYGMRVNGATDVMRFRNWYREVTQLTRPREAA